MKINKLIIHNFRSFIDEEIELQKYSIFVGENNAGKSNIFRALRVFYEELKYDENKDFPKKGATDSESRIEIHYQTNEDEQNNLKDEYKSSDGILKIRKYLKGEKAKNNQSNLYAYEGGKISNNYFYGAKNISQAKLGQILFIPELSKVEDNLKTSGPSTLRNIINFVISKIIKGSHALGELEKSFEEFNSNFKGESSSDNFSISSVENDINNEIGAWGVNFGININKINTDDIVKNLISPHMKDLNLDPGNNEISIDAFGQGLQRNLIYSLIKISAKYKDITNDKKREFNPDFTLILFEEPEAFLHPTQQDKLNFELKKLSDEESQQIFITSHSPKFISKNVEDIPSIIRIRKNGWLSKHYQILFYELKDLFKDNKELSEILNREVSIEKESIWYYLRLDSERAQAFFSKIVILCEGPTEKVFFNYLLDNVRTELKDKHIYILETGGKYNIHRFMNLFGKLGINHSVIFDKDGKNHEQINDFLKKNGNEFTKTIDLFEEGDIESFLGINKPKQDYLKPANILIKYKNNEIPDEKINNLKEKFLNLID